jgi:C1q domain
MGLDIGNVATLTAPGGVLSLDAASNWMKVNASGILTRPQTPFFRGHLTGRGAPYNGGGGSLLITALVNVGNCWNDATGYFTCPVAGYYMAQTGGICGPSGTGYLYIQKNGADMNFTHWNHSSNWHYVSLSSVVSCAASDTIRFVIKSPNPATAGMYGEVNHQMHSIALMA